MNPTPTKPKVTNEEFRKLLTETEIKGLDEMRQREPELTKRWTDAFLARFYFARKGDVTRAVTMLQNHVAWREKWSVDSDLKVESFNKFFQSGMNIWAPAAKDNSGRAVTYLRPRNLDPTMLDDMKTYLHFTYFSTDILLDTDISFMREGMIVVEDFNGASLSTFSGMMSGKIDMKEMMDNLQENVPMRIRQIIILDAPWYVRLLIAFIKPFLKKRMRKKIVSIATSELTKYVPKENIPQEYGGDLDFDYMAWMNDMLEHRTFLSDGNYFNLDGAEIHRDGYAHKKTEGEGKKKKKKKDKAKKKNGEGN